MKKSFFVFAILAFIVVLSTIWASLGYGPSLWSVFIDIPSLIIILLISVFLLLTNYSPGEVVLAFTIGFKKDRIKQQDLKKSINLFDSLGKYLIISAVLTTLAGLIAMLAVFSQISVDGNADWGGGIALAMLTILYSLILYLIIVIPFRNGLKNRLIEIE